VALDVEPDVARRGAGEEPEALVLLDSEVVDARVLREAGAGAAGIVAIGRHINPNYADNAERLKDLPRFSWERCAFE